MCKVQVLVFSFVPGDNFCDNLYPSGDAVRIGNPDAIQAVLQALQVFSQAKCTTRIHRNNFVHPVAEDEAAIQHGNPGFL